MRQEYMRQEYMRRGTHETKIKAEVQADETRDRAEMQAQHGCTSNSTGPAEVAMMGMAHRMDA